MNQTRYYKNTTRNIVCSFTTHFQWDSFSVWCWFSHIPVRISSSNIDIYEKPSSTPLAMISSSFKQYWVKSEIYEKPST